MQVPTPRFIPTQRRNKCQSKLLPFLSNRHPKGQGSVMEGECGRALIRAVQSEAPVRKPTEDKGRVN